MSDKNFVCIVEGRSDKEMLECIIPRLTGISSDNIQCIYLSGKPSLKSKVEAKVTNYPVTNSVFLIVCDQDRDDCKELKQDLLSKIPPDRLHRTKVRIACHELESFYLGDLRAIGNVLNRPRLHTQQDKQRYRTPDERPKPSEDIEELVGKMNYRKVTFSREIAPHLRLDGSNRSKSFTNLTKAIMELAGLLEKRATL